MKATAQNEEIARKIINILAQEKMSVHEAHEILHYVHNAITKKSSVQPTEERLFECEDSLDTTDERCTFSELENHEALKEAAINLTKITGIKTLHYDPWVLPNVVAGELTKAGIEMVEVHSKSK